MANIQHSKAGDTLRAGVNAGVARFHNLTSFRSEHPFAEDHTSRVVPFYSNPRNLVYS
jgi:hypothetical protein